jgi:DNA-binding NarL/FixJ family response regulator
MTLNGLHIDIAILNKKRVPILIKDNDGTLLYHNKAYADLQFQENSMHISSEKIASAQKVHSISPADIALLNSAQEHKNTQVKNSLNPTENTSVQFKKTLIYDRDNKASAYIGTIVFEGANKHTMQIHDCIDNLNGLSPREKDIVELLIKGQSVKAISKHFQISSHTVADHKKSIFEKLNAHSVAELMYKIIFMKTMSNAAEGGEPCISAHWCPFSFTP